MLRPRSIVPCDPLARHVHLTLYHDPRRTPNRIALLYTVFKVEYLLDILCEVRRELFPLRQREVGDLARGLFGQCDSSPGDVVCLTERNLTRSAIDTSARCTHALSYEVICDIGREHVHCEGGFHLLRMDLRSVSTNLRRYRHQQQMGSSV